jgi:hypothetical protein
MPRTELVVAIGDDEESWSCVDSTPEVAEQVESRVVRPVDIFEHHHAGLLTS